MREVAAASGTTQDMDMMRSTLLAIAVATMTACGDSSGPAAPRPEYLLPLGGDGQTGPPGTQLLNPLVVAVYDDRNLPLAGVTVSFFVESGSGSVTPQDAVTNANGIAQSRWTLGGAGEQRASASVARARADPLRATFSATTAAAATVLPLRTSAPVQTR